jgi:hypothetical protein
MVWDTINNLRATITDQWLWFSAAVLLVVLVGVLAALKFYKSKPYEPVQHKQDGWTPTGRVDFTDPESTGNFILHAEDTRIVDGIGGVDHREIRWRKATLDEAKTVVVAYHSQRNLAMTANFIVSSSIRPSSGMDSDRDNEHQKAQLRKDEAPDGKFQG